MMPVVANQHHFNMYFYNSSGAYVTDWATKAVTGTSENNQWGKYFAAFTLPANAMMLKIKVESIGPLYYPCP